MLQRQAFSCAALHIIPKVALVGRHCGNGDGRIQHRAAAQGYDEITSIFPGESRARHHRIFKRVFHDTGKDGRLYAGCLKLF